MTALVKTTPPDIHRGAKNARGRQDRGRYRRASRRCNPLLSMILAGSAWDQCPPNNNPPRYDKGEPTALQPKNESDSLRTCKRSKYMDMFLLPHINGWYLEPGLPHAFNIVLHVISFNFPIGINVVDVGKVRKE